MPNKSSQFDPSTSFIGGYTENDGTIEFYSRINACINDHSVVVDLGAGRAAWYEDDTCNYRRQIRFIKPKVKKLIGLDIDAEVLSNNSTHENKIIKDGILPIEDHSVDIIIADYVLEHVADPVQFVSEVRRVLKNGGLICGRTPHLLNYVSLAARLIPNALKATILSSVQPGRLQKDVFPTFYKLNTQKALKTSFPDFKNFSYTFRTKPAYYMGNRTIYHVTDFIHTHAPKEICGNIFVFLVKEEQ